MFADGPEIKVQLIRYLFGQDISMKKQFLIMSSFLFVLSTWAMADSDLTGGELLDTYLEDDANFKQTPKRSPVISQEPALIDGNNLQGAAATQNTESQPVYVSEDITIYEAKPARATESEVEFPEIVSTRASESAPSEEFEIIELESYNEKVVTVEADGKSSTHVASTSSSPHGYCQQNPLTKECLYSNYATLCKKDPQSAQCKSQLEKFDKFCNTFPRSYKCKKAQLAATCSQQPNIAECKSFTERYCQKYPKAVFCDQN